MTRVEIPEEGIADFFNFLFFWYEVKSQVSDVKFVFNPHNHHKTFFVNILFPLLDKAL